MEYEISISSAHRSPEKTRKYIRDARRRGIKVVIAGAGGAAHLAGALAAETTLPVIGVPIPSGPLQGVDALLSICQMPGGIPVATMSIGKAGAKNAGILAAQILALSNAGLSAKLLKYKKSLAAEVEKKDRGLKSGHGQNR
jgi:phosphoribosylaminoimidazole carboxylase PurE protein